jgi:probable phosphoglycerate mutase
MLEAEVASRFPDQFSAWSRDPASNAPPGGETANHIAGRALPVVASIRARHSGDVLVVSHKATIRILVCALLGIDLALFRARVAQRVGAVTTFEFPDSGPRLLRLSDVSHLPHELREEVGS